MRTVLAAVLAFVLGAIASYVVAVAGFFLYMHASNVFDRDGGMSMGIVFMIGPLCGAVGGVAAAVATALWLRRREHERPKDGPRKPWPRTVQLTGALIAGIAVYLMGLAVVWLRSPLIFDSYWTAVLVSFTPQALGLATAGVLAYRILRRPRAA